MVQHEHHRAFHVTITFFVFNNYFHEFKTYLLVSLGSRPFPACFVDDATQRDDYLVRRDPLIQKLLYKTIAPITHLVKLNDKRLEEGTELAFRLARCCLRIVLAVSKVKKNTLFKLYLPIHRFLLEQSSLHPQLPVAR